ncbi:acyl-CoA thioester hydrolase [Advenella incenata]|jgi:acyl-CoA thioester hydrolase|uniref:Acyl-CoA thioester hydrolase n=1 Tax=Advenella incenata TaxID=267800 RepID=A0A4Q7VST3_9BURK|nr:thioesterase family protein [Advenella incenata]RZT99620.1 acyl-CoA thioester hydrolase [Advenella incenata]
MISTEYVVNEAPFVIRRRVKWGDCDPAGVVYTVTFSEYVISAAELFYGHLLGGTPQRVKDEHGFGTPTRALAFDFRASLWPDEEFDMAVYVENIGQRTYTLHIAGSVRGQAAFDARLTPICVARGERRAIALPDILRDALLGYQHDCEQQAPYGSTNQ